MKIATEVLDTMQALVQAATPGPWEVTTKGNSVRSFSIDGVCHGMKPNGANAAFISAARAFVPQAVEALRFTEARTQEALLLLYQALTDPDISDWQMVQLIEWAAQKLRPEPAPTHDAEALEQLARKYPIELPWMEEEEGGEAL